MFRYFNRVKYRGEVCGRRFSGKPLELGNMGFGEELIKSNLIGEIRSIQGVRAVDIELSDAVPDVDEIIRLRNLTVNAWGGVEGETARY